MPSFINGPFNYIQLNGNINNIKKNITIFIDVHLDLNNQTRCESFDSIDISQYLYNIIKTTTIPLDFFLEVREEQLKEKSTNKRDIYINEVIEMFKKEFVLEKDKVKYYKFNKNVRLHYLDIRDHLKFLTIKNKLDKEILPKLKFLNSTKLNKSDRDIILNEIKIYFENIKSDITDILEKYIAIRNDKLFKIDGKYRDYYLKKIIHKYNHKSIRDNILEYFKNFLITYHDEFIVISTGIVSNIMFNNDIIDEHLINEQLKKLFELYNKLNNNILKLYAFITDIYFLRRFLDKDYIQNVITYCGRNHGINYIYFLVKYCNFEIIKIYNTGELKTEDITNKIKETTDINIIYNLFLFQGEKPLQCIEKPNYKLLELGW